MNLNRFRLQSNMSLNAARQGFGSDTILPDFCICDAILILNSVKISGSLRHLIDAKG